MSEYIAKERETKSINTILIAVSFIIFGVLGVVFVTQMELHPGWVWEDLRDVYPLNFDAFETDDMNGDGINDILGFAEITRGDDRAAINTPQYGNVILFNGANGAIIWKNEYNTPVKRAFQIMDANSDGVRDFFVYRAEVSENFTGSENNQVEILPNMSINHMISGKATDNGDFIPILTGDGLSFTNFSIVDLVSFDNILDDKPDLIALEGEYVTNPFIGYNWSISSYFINGTRKSSTFVGTHFIDLNWRFDFPAIELFNYSGSMHLMYISGDYLKLFNLSSTNYMDEIYSKIMLGDEISYKVVEDLTSDNIPEVLLISRPDRKYFLFLVQIKLP
ncbi:MAG: hypothetical protein ACW98D_11290 [Promethearchaeota archaeon]|jgi:hypothetical protein